MDGWIILNCCMYRNRYGVVYCNKHAPVYISILLCYAPFPFLCDPPTSTCSHLYRTLLQTSAPFTHCSFLFVYWYLMTLCSSSVIKLPLAESSSSCVYRSRSISEVHQRGIYVYRWLLHPPLFSIRLFIDAPMLPDVSISLWRHFSPMQT